MCAALGGNAQVINRVDCLYGSRSLRVTRIEYGDEATKVTFKTTKECGPTLKVGHGIYLVDDNGKRHHAIAAEGIQFDSLYVMVKGQKRKFTISFHPVNTDNNFLDIRDQKEGYYIYGLYDMKERPNVPEVSTDIDHDELALLTNGKDGDVEISGTYHSTLDQYETVLYFAYNFFGNELDYADHYAKTDSVGRFHLKFHTHTPALVFFWKGYKNVRNFPRERMYIHPGDKIKLELTDWDEGKEQSYNNLSGRMAYNKIINASDLLLFYAGLHWKYTKAMNNMSIHKDYDDIRADALECCKRELNLANYICWHNRLSPYESRLYFNSIRLFFVSFLLNLDWAVKIMYDNIKDINNMAESERSKYDAADSTRCLSIMGQADYSYLKLIDPNDLSLIADPDVSGTTSMLANMRPIQGCHDMVPEGDPDRWMKVIGLQQKKLERIAGWTGMPLLVQLMIVKDYPLLFGWEPADDRQYRQVRELLTLPCCQTYLDLMHKQLQDKESQRHTSQSLRK